MSFSEELRAYLSALRRRRVFRAVAVYAVVAWIAVQIATATFPYLRLADEVVTAVIIVAAAGFPFVVLVAWAADARARAGQPASRPPRARAVWLAAACAALVVVAGGFYAVLSRAPDGDAGTEARAATPPLEQVTFSAAVEEYPDFAPDGSRLVFSREVDGYRQLFVTELDTGADRQLTSEPRDHILPVWSPDGAAIAFVRAGEAGGTLQPTDLFGPYQTGDVWRLDLETGQERLLLRDAANPAFSPDGRQIAFDASWAGPRRIWVADAFGRNPQQATADASEAVEHVAPRWSPDGRRIVFQNIEKTKFDIRVVDLPSRTLVSLTDDPFINVDPVWTPDGGGVVFSSVRGGGLNLWRIPVDATGHAAGQPQQLTMGAGQDVQASVSPDGRRVAFVTRSLNADLWRLPVSPETGRPTGPPEPLVATTREDSRGAWSPDGHLLVFNSDRGGDMNLWLLSLEDGSQRQLTGGPGGDFQPRFSPDGERIVFFSSRSGNADIWEVEVATGELRQLTTASALDVNPFFSPDGRRIAFQSDREGRKEVWVMDADGSNQRQLTMTGAGDHFMLWSADGSRIIYTLGGGRVMEVPVDGGEARPVGFAVQGGGHMSFSPDSSLIIDVLEHRTAWVSPVAGGDPYPVFEFDDPDVRIDYPMWSPDGRWLVFERSRPTGADVWVLEMPAAR